MNEINTFNNNLISIHTSHYGPTLNIPNIEINNLTHNIHLSTVLLPKAINNYTFYQVIPII